MKCYGTLLAVLMFTGLVSQQSMAESQMWGNDVLVHQANHIYSFGMDQGCLENDTLVLVVSDSSTTSLRDSLYVYRSINNGQTWTCVDTLFSTADNERFGKVEIAALRGTSKYVFVFYMHNAKLWYLRYPYNLSGSPVSGLVSDDADVVLDFAVCQDLGGNRLYVAYLNNEPSLIFERSTDFGATWTERKDLSKIGVPISSQLSIARSMGNCLVVAGRTSNDSIYTIRNTNYGSSTAWTSGQYPSGLGSCGNPVVEWVNPVLEVGEHPTCWLFYERLVTTPNPHYVLYYHYSVNSCSTWSSGQSLEEPSNGDLFLPSLRSLKEFDASDITLGYLYRIGVEPDRVSYTYRQAGQGTLTTWPISYTGINDADHEPLSAPPPKAYTMRRTDNLINSVVLYVDTLTNGLYFDASSFVGIEEEIGYEPIKGFALNQNYPNPFNVSTAIEYSLQKDGEIQITVYNILGQRTKTLLSGHKSRGNHKITWDGTDEGGNPVVSGIYFYEMKSNQQTLINKMVLLK